MQRSKTHLLAVSHIFRLKSGMNTCEVEQNIVTYLHCAALKHKTNEPGQYSARPTRILEFGYVMMVLPFYSTMTSTDNLAGETGIARRFQHIMTDEGNAGNTWLIDKPPNPAHEGFYAPKLLIQARHTIHAFRAMHQPRLRPQSLFI